MDHCPHFGLPCCGIGSLAGQSTGSDMAAEQIYFLEARIYLSAGASEGKARVLELL